ncbi:amino acid adenylation domain-containing protein [Sphaerisporangium sp. NPDC051017]|uniref:amino acid adenylation domain-containing protein n=1 Tax=Sphaerisporangium sp. NPDC051017 TaxID=3154636 RepID=UPI00343E5030
MSDRYAQLRAKVLAEPAKIPVVPRLTDGSYPMSHAQERLWFLDQLEGSSASYNVPVCVRFRGPVDVPALERALQTVVSRHEVLRTVYESTPDGCSQVVRHADGSFVRFSEVSSPQEFLRLPFDLRAAPPLRAAMVRHAVDDHLFLLSVHHIAFDGWSVGVLVREMIAAYHGEVPEPAKVQYVDYAAWQRNSPSSSLEWWRERLTGAEPLSLPLDRPRPEARSEQGGLVSFDIDVETGAALRQIARRHSATPFMVLLAVFLVLLRRHSGQSDISVGTPVANRDHDALDDVIGLFVNTVVLRVDVADVTFGELVDRVRQVALDALAHQDVPFERVVEAVNPSRGLGRSPLFKVLFTMNTPGEIACPVPGLHASFERLSHELAKFDIAVDIEERPDGSYRGAWQYDGDIFDQVSAVAMTTRLVRLASVFAAAEEQVISQAPILDAAERAALASAWNSTADWADDGVGVHELFLRQADLTPDAPALAQGPTRISYCELADWTGAIATHVGPGLTGLCVPRGPAGIAGLLGILRAGGAYVPLDPELPAARLQYMIADGGLATIVVDGAAPPRLAEALEGLVPRPRLVDMRAPAAGPVPVASGGSRLCYVIYTSGTTGRPKGVAVEHRNLAHYARSVLDTLGDVAGLHFASVSTLSADLGNTSIFPALIGGGCVHVLDHATATDPELFGAYVSGQAIDVVKIVPSHFAALHHSATGPDALVPRRALIFGGEMLSRSLIAGLSCAVYNHYGPTETCVGSLMSRVDGGSGPVPIGRPLGATRLAVLDSGGRPVPRGVVGMLHIAGPGVARGYLNRPGLTAERFVALPGKSGRFYRTGDLVRTLMSGEIEFVGRTDGQVKVRGHRVELGEVERAIAAEPGVRQAVVVPIRDGATVTALAAYAVGDVTTAQLAKALRTLLPAHLVPSTITVVPEIPRTLNGKVDHAALPAPHAAVSVTDVPRSGIEERLRAIWQDVLGHPVGLDDDLFQAGGHSLLLIRLVARVRSELGRVLAVRDCFTHPTIRGLAAILEQAASVRTTIPVLERTDGARYLMSFAQERLWFLNRLDPGTAFYNVPVAVRLRGALNVRRITAALRELISRHEVLRTTYPDGHQVVKYPDGAHFELSEARDAEEFLSLPFDLATEPPVRAALIRDAEDDHLLLVSVHHIAFDGESVGTFTKELGELYAGRLLPPLPLQYLDYAAWQRDQLGAARLDELVQWWKRRLMDAEPLALPFDRPRPAVQRHRGGVIPFHIDAATGEAVRRVARGHGATNFMVLLAAFIVLLRRYGGQRDISVGTPVANRELAELDGVAGFFVNTLVLRVDVDEVPFGELVERVRATVLDALAHQEAPFEKVVEEVNPSRNLSHSPLFQVMFGMSVPGSRDTGWMAEGVTAATERLSHGLSKYDVSVNVQEHDDGSFEGTWQYDVSLFDKQTAATMTAHLVRLIQAFAKSDDLVVTQAQMLGDSEQRELLTRWNDTAAEFEDAGVHEFFVRQAERSPGAPAVVQGERRITYGELASWSAAIAERIGSGEQLVGICIPRGLETVAGLLGVLRTGAAYVPLDHQLPPARLRRLIEDAGLTTVIVNDRPSDNLREALAGLPVRLVDVRACTTPTGRPLPEHGGGDRLCYVIYTSGSTGLPKGVLVHHRGVVNYTTFACREYGIAAGTTVLLHSPITFDLTVTTMLAPLIAGATIEIVEGDDIEDLAAALRDADEPYQVVKLTPAHLRVLNVALAREIPRRTMARCLVVGGEALHAERVRPWVGRSRIVNEYGPTETVVGCTIFEAADTPGDVPIGHPIANTTNHVLDEHLQLVPFGVVGELCVGGAGVTHGYLNQPELTAERFVDDPFSDGRLYRTGDLVVRRRDGVLEYRGRDDSQVKVRGHRVELGEIEAVTREVPGVRDACVLYVRRGGFDALVAYVVTDTTATEVRDALRKALPQHMVPNQVQLMDTLPLTSNGKVDRVALPAGIAVAQAEVVPVRGETERRVHEMWTEVLGVDRIGRTENFFDAGGHSLLLVGLHDRITSRFGAVIELLDLFRTPTIAALAELIDKSGTPASQPEPAPARRTRADVLATLRKRRQGI